MRLFTAVLLPLVLITTSVGQTTDTKTDWQSIFDGKSLAGWRSYHKETVPDGWVVVDGSLHRNGKGGDIMTVDTFADFELTFDWKVAKGANSGVIYRVRLGDSATYMSGIEYQILDNEVHHDGQSDVTSAGALYALYPTQQDLVKPVGEWNSGRIVVQGQHVEHWLNGTKIVDCELWSDDWNQRFETSKFKGWSQFARTKQGHIALQDHGDPVWFRNLKLRELPASATP